MGEKEERGSLHGLWLWPGMREQGKGAHPMAAPSTALGGDGGERESAGGVGSLHGWSWAPHSPWAGDGGEQRAAGRGGRMSHPPAGAASATLYVTLDISE